MITVKKIFTWAFVGFLIFFIAFRPEGAAEMFRSVGIGLLAIAQGFGDFLTSLVA